MLDKLVSVVGNELKTRAVGIEYLAATRRIFRSGGGRFHGVADADERFVRIQTGKASTECRSPSRKWRGLIPCSADALQRAFGDDLNRDVRWCTISLEIMVQIEAWGFEACFPRLRKIQDQDIECGSVASGLADFIEQSLGKTGGVRRLGLAIKLSWQVEPVAGSGCFKRDSE